MLNLVLALGYGVEKGTMLRLEIYGEADDIRCRHG
jgi:hypothetical protein